MEPLVVPHLEAVTCPVAGKIGPHKSASRFSPFSVQIVFRQNHTYVLDTERIIAISSECLQTILFGGGPTQLAGDDRARCTATISLNLLRPGAPFPPIDFPLHTDPPLADVVAQIHIEVRQKKSWVDSGSGNLPSE